MSSGGPSWLSKDVGDVFPWMEGTMGHKGDARSVRFWLSTSAALARRMTLIGLLFGLLLVPVSHLGI